MKKLILSAAAFLLLFFVSCKKDKKDCEKNVADISGSYKVTAATYTAPGIPGSVNYYAQLDDCEKDDLYVLSENGDFDYDDAGTQCSPPGDYSGTWSVNGNIITIDGEDFTIDSFDCTNLVASISNFGTAGDKLTVTFKKQ